MVSRNHNNRSEKQKGHANHESDAAPEQDFSSDAGERSRGDGGGNTG
jgi:hypothetical protein